MELHKRRQAITEPETRYFMRQVCVLSYDVAKGCRAEDPSYLVLDLDPISVLYEN